MTPIIKDPVYQNIYDKDRNVVNRGALAIVDVKKKNPVTSIVNHLSKIITKSAIYGASAYAFSTVWNRAVNFSATYITTKTAQYVSHLNVNLAVTCGIVAGAALGLFGNKKSSTCSKVAGIAIMAFSALQACRYNLVYKLKDLALYGRVLPANDIPLIVNLKQVIILTSAVCVVAFACRKGIEYVSNKIDTNAKIATRKDADDLTLKDYAFLSTFRAINVVKKTVNAIYA